MDEATQAILARYDAMLTALSGRIDAIERERVSTLMQDVRREKRLDGIDRGLHVHAGDAIAHTYRDYFDQHRIPGMDDLTDYDGDGTSGTAIDIVMMTWTYVSSISDAVVPWDTIVEHTNDAVLLASTINHTITVLADGLYEIAAGLPTAAPYAFVENDLWGATAQLYLQINGTAASVASSSNDVFVPEGYSPSILYTPFLVPMYCKTLSANDVIRVYCPHTSGAIGGPTSFFIVKKLA